MVFSTTITFIGPSGSNTIEINESPTKELANEWKKLSISSWYASLVGVKYDGDQFDYVLPEQLNDIMNYLNGDEEINYQIDIINFVIEMKKKYMKKNTMFTISECEIKK
jgi:hypothetical protein